MNRIVFNLQIIGVNFFLSLFNSFFSSPLSLAIISKTIACGLTVKAAKLWWAFCTVSTEWFGIAFLSSEKIGFTCSKGVLWWRIYVMVFGKVQFKFLMILYPSERGTFSFLAWVSFVFLEFRNFWNALLVFWWPWYVTFFCFFGLRVSLEMWYWTIMGHFVFVRDRIYL